MVQAKKPEIIIDADQRHLNELRKLLEESSGSALMAPGVKPIQLPTAVRAILLEAIRDLASGKAVSLVSVGKDLTTQQAADILNVSRPYLITLLERGDLPFYMTGSHRRVPLAAVLDYKKQRDEARRSTLRQMAREAHQYGMYEV